MVIIITIAAFVINVGLYVKARINLQNAVDAAAWSGAAVQARQLTTISHLNWEMRNVYKEWMFKYYVLGQVGLKNVSEISNYSGKKTSFQMQPFGGSIADEAQDKYNIPSVCIHFAGTVNICDIYGVPGLPRFENNGLGGIDDTFNSLLDSIVDEKAKNCSYRSRINFQVANFWIYGVPNTSATPPTSIRVPQIATDRPGAYPSALELAFRIRNVEKMVNQPPAQDVNLSNISGFANGDPANERTVKAFYSAYRNLGGPGSDGGPNYMKQNFTLTEIAPTPYKEDSIRSLSNLYIPNIYEKHYLDLKAQILNLTNFFTSFITTTENTGGTSTPSQAACEATKVAIPVPSYPIGFEKNAKVMTYYAVKGKTKFVGLFNPFTSAYDGMEITAYAAAKPFGGRVGPKLFKIADGDVKPRGATDGGFASSYPYVSSYKTKAGDYQPGIPVPHKDKFWADSSGTNTTIGGNPVGSEIKYGIPNLLYETKGQDMSSHLGGGQEIQTLTEELPKTVLSASAGGGLYEPKQLEHFIKNNIDLSQTLSPQAVSDALQLVRAPTTYEANNYLIPSIENQQGSGAESDFVSVVKKSDRLNDVSGGDSQGTSYQMNIYAPLYCPTCIYKDLAEIQTYLEQQFLQNSVRSVETFITGMKDVALEIRAKGASLGATSDNSIYNNAAAVIYDGVLTPGDVTLSSSALTCASITGMFARYFFGSDSNIVYSDKCIEPSLLPSIIEYWQYRFPPDQASTYAGTFTLRNGEDNGSTLTAYRPGPRQGAANNSGIVNHPFGASNFATMASRNFYSTKFFALKDVLTSSSNGYLNMSPIYAEQNQNAGNCQVGSFWNDCPVNGISDSQLNTIPH